MPGCILELQRFKGKLSRADDEINVAFTATVDDTGEARITLDPIVRARESSFINAHWEGGESEFGKFVLHGTADDGTKFQTDDLFFTTLGLSWNSEGGAMRPVADCTSAQVTFRRSHEDQDGVRLLLRGVSIRRPINAETPLGHLTVSQIVKHVKPAQISAEMRLSRVGTSTEQCEWLRKVDTLFEDLRHALSFALGMMIATPIQEIVAGDQRTLLVYASRAESISFMAPIEASALQAFLDAVVRTHVDSRERMQTLHFAIAWFVMDAPYSEGRLIAAMTALENLISVHLQKRDTLIQSDNRASKLRKALRAAAEEYAKTNVDDLDDRERLLKALELKMAELNRHTLRHNIDVLTQRWSVSMTGLDTETIDAAKSARDHVVHTGTFMTDVETEQGAYSHMLVARELVVRFILAALNYDGSYGSYVGGYHRRCFSHGRNELSVW